MSLSRRNGLVALLALSLIAAATCEPALADGFNQSSIPYVDKVFDWIGLTDLSGQYRDLLTFCLAGYALCFGIFTNMAIRERGFGNAGNGVVGVAGICLAIFLCSPRFHILNDLPEDVRFNVMLIAASFGSAFALIFGAVLKGIILRLLAAFLDLLGRPERPKPIVVEEEPLPPRIASALRKS
jgi:hypothetical protein